MIKTILSTIWPGLEPLLKSNDEVRAEAKVFIQAQSLSCKCGALAHPIPATADRYACSKAGCHRQFISAKHHISSSLEKKFGRVNAEYVLKNLPDILKDD